MRNDQIASGVWLSDTQRNKDFSVYQFVAASKGEAEAFKAAVEWADDGLLVTFDIQEIRDKDSTPLFMMTVIETSKSKQPATTY